jgi:hypothetical protein
MDRIAKARQEAKERVLANLPNSYTVPVAPPPPSPEKYFTLKEEIDKYLKPEISIFMSPKQVNEYGKSEAPLSANISVPKKNKTELKIIEKKRKISW